jgi:hypothetical protein
MDNGKLKFYLKISLISLFLFYVVEYAIEVDLDHHVNHVRNIVIVHVVHVIEMNIDVVKITMENIVEIIDDDENCFFFIFVKNKRRTYAIW